MTTLPSPANTSTDDGDERVDVAGASPPRNMWTWVLVAVVVMLCLDLAVILVANKHLEWGTVRHYLFAEPVLKGVLTTIWLTAVAMVVGVVLGMVLAGFRMSHNSALQAVASVFIWFFRGTPLLVQLIFWFNIGLLFPRLGIGIPFGPSLISGKANDLITPALAAVVGLGLHEAAYQAEIYRAGLMSVDEGQAEAAKSLGMPPLRIFFTIRLPQAMRFIVPPTFSQIIGMTKGTAMVSVIGGADLLFSVQQIYAQTFETIPLLVVACIWYLAITTVLNVFQYFIERHYGRGATRNARVTALDRVLAWLQRRSKTALNAPDPAAPAERFTNEL